MNDIGAVSKGTTHIILHICLCLSIENLTRLGAQGCSSRAGVRVASSILCGHKLAFVAPDQPVLSVVSSYDKSCSPSV